MKNADLFKQTFGVYATTLWAMPEQDFCNWLNTEALEQEPKTGHWINHKDEHICSCCGEMVIIDWYIWEESWYNYCPNCGAKMEDKE